MKLKSYLTLIIIACSEFLYGQSDNCATATIITLDATGNACVSGTTLNATSSNFGYGTCNPLPNVNNEVWYTYVSDGADNSWEITPQGLTDPEIIIYTGGCPADPLGVLEVCNTSAGTNVLNTNWGITAGTQVWIGVMSNQGTEGSFDLCVNSVAADPTGGNTCAGAINICDIGPTSTIDMGPLTSSGTLPTCFFGGVNNDVWFQFTVTQSGTIEWDAIPVGVTAGVELDWALYDITGGCPGVELDCNYNYTAGAGFSAGMSSAPTGGDPLEYNPPFNVVAGNTYAIVVDYFTGGGTGTMDFSFSPASTALISPLADFTINPNTPTCASSVNVAITDNSIGAIPDWNYGDGGTSSGSNPADYTYNTPGTYAITQTVDDGFCVSTHTEFVELYGPLSITPTPTLETCAGDCDGSISLSSSGGSGIYSYAWDIGGSTGPTNDNLCAGNYQVTLTDATCGPLTQTITLASGPTCVTLCSMDAINVSSTPCNTNTFMFYGDISFTGPPTTGTLDITADDGITTYDTIINPPFNSPLNWSISGIPATGANFTVSAEFSASPSCTISITETAPNSTNANAGIDDTTCTLTNTLAAVASIGTGSWTGPAGITFGSANSPTSSVTATSAGTYALTWTETIANGCPSSDVVNLTFSDLSYSTSITNSTCGASNGSIEFTATGGIAPYTYSIDNNTTVQASNNFTSLVANPYPSIVEDALGCQVSTTETVSNSGGPSIDAVSGTDPLCPGICNGSVTVTVSGGTAPYTYSINGGTSQTTSVLTGLCDGISTIQVEDINLCQVNGSVTLTAPSSVSFTSNFVDPICFGDGGSINLFPSGGTITTDYNYTIDDGINGAINQTNGVFSGLPGGTFNISITDDNGCLATGSETITEPSAVGSTVNSTTAASCAGICDGSAQVTGSGGTTGAGGYQYLWDDFDGQTSGTATGLCGGNPLIVYTVTVTDDNGCSTSRQVQISEPLSLSISSSTVQSSCGQSNGSACVTVTGGAGGYLYDWNGLGNTQCLTSVVSGGYSVTVTDANSCEISTNVIITDFGGPTASISSTDVLCFGGTEGSATVIASGGSSTFSYNWTNTAGTTISNTANAVNLSGGVYFVDVTDDVTNCVITMSTTVSEPAQLQYSSFESNPTCFSYSDGEITVNVTGGATPYSYIWNTVPTQTNAIATNLSAGFYNVDINDQNGCSTSLSYTLTEASAVTATEAKVDVSCAGGSDGSITVTPSGGTSNYSFTWSSNPFTSGTVLNLVSGNQTYTIEDNSGCSYTNTVNITEPTALSVLLDNSGNATCYNGTDGFIATNTFGGTPGYTYQWSFGLGTTSVLSGLPANTYCLTATDANGCNASLCHTITQPTELIATIPSVTDILCYGDLSGSAIASASGATPPYFYQWNAGGNFSNQASANNLGASNDVTVTITDNSGCSVNVTTSVSEPPEIIVNPRTYSSYCGQSDGAMDVEVYGGVQPFSYTWSNPSFGNDGYASGIPAGAYAVTITDANSCEFVQVFNLNDISGPSISFLNSTDPTCAGASDGIINTNVTGGTSPYQSICWYNSNLDLISCGAVGIPLLPAEIYTEIVVDSAGCVASLTIPLIDPNPVIAGIVNFTDATCFGECNGAAAVQAGGGSLSGYTYSWSATSQTTTTVTGLCAGPVACVVSDANGCSTTTSTTISEPAVLVVTNSVSDVSCFGESDGCINFTASGGASGFYQYEWDCSNNNNSSACNLPAGNCIITITDLNGCSVTSSATITEPTQLTATTSSTDAFCTAFNGSMSITGAGGTPPYTSTFAGGPTTFTSTGLYYGTYTAEISDANGCSVSASVTINDQPGPVISSIDFISPTCFGLCNGSATVNVSSGTSPLTYQWCDIASQATPTASSLCAGDYCITVTDANNCIAVDYGTLSEPSEIVVTALPPTVQVCAGECASIGAVPSGGNTIGTGYQITWSDPSITGFGPTVVCLPSNTINTYTYTVTDAMGCTASNQSVVTVGPDLEVNMPGTVQTCLGNPVSICADGFGGSSVSDYEWTWSNATSTNGSATSCQQVNPTDTTVFQVVLNDGCSTPADGLITVIVNPIPTPSYGVLENEGCPPFEAVFNGSSSMDNSTIEWDFNGDGIPDTTEYNVMIGQGSNPIYTYENSGLYSVAITVISAENCYSTVSITDYIDIYPKPIANFSLEPESTTLLNPVAEANASESIGVDSLYMWDFGDEFDTQTQYGEEISHIYSDTGNYYVALDVVNTVGCHDYDTLLFIVNPDFAIYAPNAFTPDDDGTNDEFRVKGVGISPDNFELLIYNRWGEIIFKGLTLDTEWNGTIKGSDQLAPNDVYIWKALVTPYGYTEPIELIGHVTLVK